MTIELQSALAEPNVLWLEETESAAKTQLPYSNEVELSADQFRTAVGNFAGSAIFDEIAEKPAKITWTFAPPEEHQNDYQTANHKQTTWHDAPLNLVVANAAFKGSQASFGPISLILDSGEFLVVCGQTEAIRTMFSRMLIGLVRPNQGTISVNGQDLQNVSHSDLAHWRQWRVSYVSDNAPLWCMLTVLDNLLLPSYNQGNSALIQHEAEAVRLLKLCGLETYRDCPASELTIEQAKLMVLLRSFIKQPQLLIYDNATNSFSPEIEALIWKILAHYHQNGMTIICTATSPQYKSWQTHNYLPHNHRQITL